MKTRGRKKKLFKKKTPNGRTGIMNNDEFFSKSEPAIEASIVKQVMNEQNLTGFISPQDIEKAQKNTSIVSETQHGTVRIEGEVTPEKLQKAKEFDAIFAAATSEIMNLAEFIPNEATLDFVKSRHLSQSKINEIKNALPWTIFRIDGEDLMKTQDNKLEKVQNYCYRLEKAVLDQIKIRKQSEECLRGVITTNNYTINSLERENHRLKLEIHSLQHSASFGLLLKAIYGTLKMKIRDLF